MTPRPAWVEYELLARDIVRELAPFADVQHNVHELGRESETTRQIDVAVRWNDGIADNLLIIQVRDRKRKADVNTIGEFRSVILDVNAQRGILICSGGFSKSAVKYARNIGLQLWSLADARSKKWTHELTVPVIRNQLLPQLSFHGQFRSQTRDLTIRKSDDRWGLWTTEQDEPIRLEEYFRQKWAAGSLSLDTNEEHEFQPEAPLYIVAYRADDSSEHLAVSGITVKYKVARTTYLAHLRPDDYRGVLDHLQDGLFVPSHLDLVLPSLESGQWTKVSDPSRVVVNVRGVFLTVDDRSIGDSSWERFTITPVDE